VHARRDWFEANSAPALAGATIEVATRPVLRGGWRAYYLGVSALVLAGVLVIAHRWLTLPGRDDHVPLHWLATLVLGYEVVVWGMRWTPLWRMRRPAPLPPRPGLRVAAVTTIVPGAEPLRMLEQTLAALVALRIPHDTWVLDEGDDPAVQALAARLGVRHFTRRHRPEYQAPAGRFAARSKHGNYNAWLAEHGFADYDVLAAFDSDQVPEPDYLERTLGYFQDPAVGYVQAAQVYYNQPASFIARGAAEETYAYYSTHQMASYALGHPIVVGSHGVHRLAALATASPGGFPDHDAEDLLLTMRYRAAGWRGVYVPEVLALGTTPVNWRGYLVQQARWARSVLDLKREAVERLLHGRPTTDNLLALFHGAHFLRPLLWLLLFPALLGMLVNNAVPAFLEPEGLALGLGLLLLLHLADRFRHRYFLDPEREGGIHWRAGLLQYAKWPHFAGALLDVLRGRDRPYALTPKATGGAGRFVLAPVHCWLAAAVAVAWLVGTIRFGHVEPELSLLALLVGGASLLLAWTETWSYPAPYDPALLPRRRAEMGELLVERPA